MGAEGVLEKRGEERGPVVVRLSDMDEEEEIEDLEDFQEDFENQPTKLKQKKTSAVMNFLKIPADMETVATYLQGKNFRTGGFIGIWTVTKRFGYDRGLVTVTASA